MYTPLRPRLLRVLSHLQLDLPEQGSNGEQVEVEREKIQSFKKVDPYVCVVRAKEEYFKGWKTVRHILREICRHVY